MGEDIKKTKKTSKPRRTKNEYKDYKCGPEQSLFTPDAGLVEGPINCGVCDTEMTVTRGHYGPRSWAGAMAGCKSKYDTFECPHRKELWHVQATMLREKARYTCSGRLAEMFLEEAVEIINTRTATKEDGLWRVIH